jgi:cytochrome c
MNALSKLIKRVTMRQIGMARTTEELSTILDRTIAFAEGENPYLSEQDVEDIAAVVPVPDPVTEGAEESDLAE